MQGIDDAIVLFFQNGRSSFLTAFFKIFIPLELWMIIAMAIVIWHVFRYQKLFLPVISFLFASHLSVYACDFLKEAVQRPRPFRSIEGTIPLLTPHTFSFPSGHATLAMAMAVVLAKHFPKSAFVVYSLALCVGLSRVYFGVHFMSDVLAGFLLGGLLGQLSLRLERAVITATAGVDLRKSG